MVTRKPLGAGEVDRRLRKALHDLQLAERNAVLWFGEVFRRRLFRDLGFASIYQYAEEALGFSRPRTAQFIRLCESLEGLPVLKRSVAAGDVPWTKAREVAKVATPRTEAAWVEVARTESRRRIERRVRMAQTRSRARRRVGGQQLGIATEAPPAGAEPRTLRGNEGRQPGPVAGSRQFGPPRATDPPPASAVDPSGRPCMLDDAQDESSDLAFAEVPVTLSLRFTPEQYARYEAMLEQLRKRGERSAREELVLAGLELLLDEAVAMRPRGEGAVRGRGMMPRAVRGEGPSAPPCAPGDEVDDPRGEGAIRGRGVMPGAVRGEGAISPRNPKQPSRIPVYQIVVQQCEDCGRARVQTGRGARPIDEATAEAMRCDARVFRPAGENHPGEKPRPGGENRPGEKSRPGGENHPGTDTGPGGENRPDGINRATIPPGVRREVMARDGHRCRAPGCRSARFLEVHHLRPRVAGGSNRPDNLVTLCSACHRLAHARSLHGMPLARAPSH